MANCPVCEKDLHDPLPPLCNQCGWDVENDLTLTPSLDKIPENVQSKYEQRLAIAKRNWQELLRLKEQQTTAEKSGEQTPAEAKEKTKPLAKQQSAVTIGELNRIEKKQRLAKETLVAKLVLLIFVALAALIGSVYFSALFAVILFAIIDIILSFFWQVRIINLLGLVGAIIALGAITGVVFWNIFKLCWEGLREEYRDLQNKQRYDK